jgi:hypothetical protein
MPNLKLVAREAAITTTAFAALAALTAFAALAALTAFAALAAAATTIATTTLVAATSHLEFSLSQFCQQRSACDIDVTDRNISHLFNLLKLYVKVLNSTKK